MLILLVEDDAAEARLTQMALHRTGIAHHLQIVTDGEMALQFLRREGPYVGAATPSIVLLDLNLPRKPGTEVLREIKSDSDLCSIPTIVLSNSRAPEDIKNVYRLRGNCYLSKPTELEELFAMMRSLVEFWLRRAVLPQNAQGDSPLTSGSFQ